MLYDPRGIAPRNLSDGIGLRLDEGKGMRAMDYDFRRTFFLRHFIFYEVFLNKYEKF